MENSNGLDEETVVMAPGLDLWLSKSSSCFTPAHDAIFNPTDAMLHLLWPLDIGRYAQCPAGTWRPNRQTSVRDERTRTFYNVRLRVLSVSQQADFHRSVRSSGRQPRSLGHRGQVCDEDHSDTAFVLSYELQNHSFHGAPLSDGQCLPPPGPTTPEASESHLVLYSNLNLRIGQSRVPIEHCLVFFVTKPSSVTKVNTGPCFNPAGLSSEASEISVPESMKPI
ncbi:hypothetical protein EYF80_006641 [Liparis tanakae]|uniref:Uncharacterized protein n=1 Tax=Liparis tanakae TaxID=230148 RepID=A0A4Z2IZP3_9TELE|nr:hypothetical protein EYF80_006641 [Liparis tanakae]